MLPGDPVPPQFSKNPPPPVGRPLPRVEKEHGHDVLTDPVPPQPPIATDPIPPWVGADGAAGGGAAAGGAAGGAAAAASAPVSSQATSQGKSGY